METALKPVQDGRGRKRRWPAEKKLAVLQEWKNGVPLEEVCRKIWRERRADVSLEAEPRAGAQGVRRDGPEEPSAGAPVGLFEVCRRQFFESRVTARIRFNSPSAQSLQVGLMVLVCSFFTRRLTSSYPNSYTGSPPIHAPVGYPPILPDPRSCG